MMGRARSHAALGRWETRRIPALITLSDSSNTTCDNESPCFRRAKFAQAHSSSRASFRKCRDVSWQGVMALCRHVGPICRKESALTSRFGMPKARNRIRTTGGFGALAGVLPSGSRACIRMCEIPERGDRWRFQRCRGDTPLIERLDLGKPSSPCGGNRALGVCMQQRASHGGCPVREPTATAQTDRRIVREGGAGDVWNPLEVNA